ncbi:MAG: hypothetical protein D6685_04480 [Bacteroidetes bacterium]|nr:MAG: hypothetical protein D6685_04480 [Bacteroidota bacterium]
MPEGFDERAFRAANRGEAENQARWMLIRDKVVEQEGLAVTDADYDAFFEEMVGDNDAITPAQMRQFYQSMPELMDQVEQRLLSRKVFDVLLERFRVVDTDQDGFVEAMKARREADSAAKTAASDAEAEADVGADAGADADPEAPAAEEEASA